MHHSFMAEAKKTTRKILKGIGYDVLDYTNGEESCPLVRFGYCYEARYPNKTQKMKTVSLTLDIWSNKQGSAEVMDIAHNIEMALDGYKGDTGGYYNIIGISIGNVDILEEELKVNGSNKNLKLYHGTLPVDMIMMEVMKNV